MRVSAGFLVFNMFHIQVKMTSKLYMQCFAITKQCWHCEFGHQMHISDPHFHSSKLEKHMIEQLAFHSEKRTNLGLIIRRSICLILSRKTSTVKVTKTDYLLTCSKSQWSQAGQENRRQGSKQEQVNHRQIIQESGKQPRGTDRWQKSRYPS